MEVLPSLVLHPATPGKTVSLQVQAIKEIGLSAADYTMDMDGNFIARKWVSKEKADKLDRKSTRLNSSHIATSRMPSSA